MMQSMTGYGKAELNLLNANFTVELRSLNSKQIDVNVKMPSIYRDKEIGIRKLLSEKLQRGKIEFSIWRENSENVSKYTINLLAVKDYHEQILKLKENLNLKSRSFWGSTFHKFGLNRTDIISTLLKMPNTLTKEERSVDENEWSEIQKGVEIAIDNLLQFRIDEGNKLAEDIILRINKIKDLLNDILPFAKERIVKVKKNLSEKLEQINAQEIDNNRLEQELIYYLEKQDVTEEQVRLSSHLEYFLDTIKSDFPNGKKLGFIGQEIGREINTIGAKSSDAEMQKIVVQMKDELEKIKEQLLNVL